MRSFDPIFYHFEKEICVYQWERQYFPNGAIFIALTAQSEAMRKNIEFIIQRNKGWGFKEAELTYDLPLDLLVLPCSWFDGDWIQNPYHIGTTQFFENTEQKYDFTNFFTGSFCYHWHNNWQKPIAETSVINQLQQIIQNTVLSN